MLGGTGGASLRVSGVCVTCSPHCTLISQVPVKLKIAHRKISYFLTASALQVTERKPHDEQLSIISYAHKKAVLEEE